MSFIRPLAYPRRLLSLGPSSGGHYAGFLMRARGDCVLYIVSVCASRRALEARICFGSPTRTEISLLMFKNPACICVVSLDMCGQPPASRGT